MQNNTSRPVEFVQIIGDKICDRVSSGESVLKICEEANYPTRTTFYQWLREYPEFANNYTRAKDWYAEVVFDDMERISDDENIDPNRARLMIDTRKWILGRLKPKKYGDKLAIGGADDLPPVQTQSTLDVSGLSLEQLDALQAAFSKKSEA